MKIDLNNDLLNFLQRLTRRPDIPAEMFKDIDSWILNLIKFLEYDDCLFIPLLSALLKYSCNTYIIERSVPESQNLICTTIVNPSIIALTSLLEDKLMLYKTLVNIECILRSYNIRHGFLCKLLIKLTNFIINIKIAEITNNCNGKMPVNVLKRFVNSLRPNIIKYTRVNSPFWTRLFNCFLRVKLEYIVSDSILNLEIASTTDGNNSHKSLIIEETVKVIDLLNELKTIDLNSYIERAEKLKNRLVKEYCADLISPMMECYTNILVDLADHSFHGKEIPINTKNSKTPKFKSLTDRLYATVVPRFFVLLLKAYMELMLKLPIPKKLCENCYNCYIQQHLNFLYEIMSCSHEADVNIKNKIGKEMADFDYIFTTIKGVLIAMVGSEHILSVNWFNINKLIPKETSELVHSIALGYSPHKSITKILSKFPFGDRNIIQTAVSYSFERENVKILINYDWIESSLFHESHLLIFYRDGLLVSIVDLTHITGIMKHPCPSIPYISFPNDNALWLITDEWVYGGIETLDGLSHQPIIALSFKTSSIKDKIYKMLTELINTHVNNSSWMFPKCKYNDEKAFASLFEKTTT